MRLGAMLEGTANGPHFGSATLWRARTESWLRCQGLIVIRQNGNVSTTFPNIWSHNLITHTLIHFYEPIRETLDSVRPAPAIH
jgi:hypothetical protein